jgi:hypothetical protein
MYAAEYALRPRSKTLGRKNYKQIIYTGTLRSVRQPAKSYPRCAMRLSLISDEENDLCATHPPLRKLITHSSSTGSASAKEIVSCVSSTSKAGFAGGFGSATTEEVDSETIGATLLPMLSFLRSAASSVAKCCLSQSLTHSVHAKCRRSQPDTLADVNS